MLPFHYFYEIQQQQWNIGAPLAVSAVPFAVLWGVFIAVPLAIAIPLLAKRCRDPDGLGRTMTALAGIRVDAALGPLRQGDRWRPHVAGRHRRIGFFYPLPYLPQVVRAVPVVIADYDARLPVKKDPARSRFDTNRSRSGRHLQRRGSDPLLQRGEIGGIVAVPKDFYRDVLHGTPTGVTVMGNGGYIVVDGAVLETTAQVVAEAAAPALAAKLVQAKVPPEAVMRLGARGTGLRQATAVQHRPGL